jgi:hypothetical protein
MRQLAASTPDQGSRVMIERIAEFYDEVAVRAQDLLGSIRDTKA